MTAPARTRTSADLIRAEEPVLAHNYHPLPVVVARAEGTWVEDVDGRRYLDMLAGYSALNFGHPVISLTLVDPRFYHLDTALFVLDDSAEGNNVAYYPEAFSPGSREVLARLYPNAVLATLDDALAFGLNSVSDGRNVFIAPQAEALTSTLADRGYVPVPVDLSEFRKAGGGIKCCTQEIRS